MRSPILFLIFNRPDTTIKVFEAIRQAQPPRLYIAADGPRATKPSDLIMCTETREIISKIDWDCKVKTLFREDNLGCGKAVSGGISWFFENEEEGIIIEDDILPHPDFFLYCDEMLDKYRHIESVKFISGRNALHGNSNSVDSYFFSAFNYVWGWAAWRRTWEIYDFSLKKKTMSQFCNVLDYYFKDKTVIRYWKTIFKQMKYSQIDTWDYQLTISLWFDNALSILPNVNLVRNIGFGEGSTHSTCVENVEQNLDSFPILPIKHPNMIFKQESSDLLIATKYRNNSYTMIKYIDWNLRFYIKLIVKYMRGLLI